MKAELRIGNLVTDEFFDSFSKVITVESINDKGINLEIQNSDDYPELQRHWIEPYYTFEQLRGIPLTEEWLLKFGFDKKEQYGWKGNGYDYQPETSKTEYQDFLIWANENAFVFRFESYSWRTNESDEWNTDFHTEIHFSGQYYEKMMERVYTMNPVKFVHQLQNLYFSLTGTELEI